MAGHGVSGAVRWFREESTGAPAALRARAEEYLERQPDHADGATTIVAAAREALAATLAHPGDRAVALDLLAADALVTLALKACAVGNPRGLGAFASHVAALGARIR